METSKEAVALELVKYIYAQNGGIATPEAVLGLYAECLGVVSGESLEMARVRLKNEKAAAQAAQ